MKKNSGVIAQHSVLCWREAMTTILCLSLTIAMVASGGIAGAQQTGKVFRIGYLDPSSASASAVLVDAFRDELRKLGWIEGKNIMSRTMRVRFKKRPRHGAVLLF